MQWSYTRGFTLIELLVVVAIISLISSMGIATLSETRGAARDAQRISEIRQIRIALEQYYNDHGRYPSEIWNDWANHICDTGSSVLERGECVQSPHHCSGGNRNGLGECGGKIGCDADNVGTIDGGCNSTTGETENILAEYMSEVPEDPINDDEHFYYFDANHTCPDQDNLKPVLFVSKLESQKGNIDTTECASTDADRDHFDGINNPMGHVTENTYVIVLEPGCYMSGHDENCD